LFVLSRMFKGQGTYIQLFRGLGFATAPQALGLIPIIGGIVGGIWSLLLAIRAVKETQQVTDGAAVAIVLIPAAIIGVLVFLLLVVLSIALFGAAAASS
ncbi:MAG: YIP1 family protein, partial [Acidimicrobiia bacterium]